MTEEYCKYGFYIKNQFSIKKNFFLAYIKMSEIADLSYYQENKDLILNKGKDFYKNNNERLRERARDKYRSLCEEEKNKKREYRKNRYHNMSEEKNKD